MINRVVFSVLRGFIGLFFICSTTQLRANDGLLDPKLINLYRGSNVNPFDVPATNNYAMKLVRQGQYDRALKLLRRAQSLAPERSDIARNAAQLALLMAQLDDLDLSSTLSYSQSFGKNDVPFIPEPWVLGANAEKIVTRTLNVEASRELLNTNPFDSESLLVTADIKLKRGDMRAALIDLKRARQLNPWMSELDGQIALLESQVSVLGNDSSNNSRPSTETEDVDSPEPFDVWSAY